MHAFDRPAARRLAIAATVIVLVAGVAAAFTNDDAGIPAGGARLTTTGTVKVSHADGSTTVVRHESPLRTGDVVEALEGTLTVKMSDGTVLEGRVGRANAAATKVKVSSPIELLDGELLVASGTGPVVEASGNSVHLSSGQPTAGRVSRGLALGTGIYEGSATVDSAGQQRTVPALRALEVSVVGRPPAQPSPLAVDGADPWDLRYLGPAIELSRRLDSLSRSFTGTLGPTQGRTPGFYELLVPTLRRQTGFSSTLFGSRVDEKPGETLIGAAIASLGTRGSFTERWNEVFDFRGDPAHGGAAWGLVALDQGVNADPLISVVESALQSTPLQFAQGAPVATGPANNGAATTNPTTARDPGEATTPPTSEPPETTPPTTIPPATIPPAVPPLQIPVPEPPSTGVPLIDGLVNTVGQLLGGLLGGGR